MTISRRQLEVFVAVAETAHVSKAGKKIFLTPSGVSMALSELENQLGGSLFHRHSRSLVLNSSGRFLLPYAKDIVRKIKEVEFSMVEQSMIISGEITVAASPTPGNYVLPHLVAAFRQLYPNVDINLVVNEPKNVEHLVRAKGADIGFIPENNNERQELICRPWFEDEIVVICGGLDPLAKRERFDFKNELHVREWVVQKSGTSSARCIADRLGISQSEVNIAMEVDNPEALKRTVESNLGLAFISSLCLVREEQFGWLKALKVEDINMKRQLKIITHSDTHISLAMNEFMAFCEILSRLEDVKYHFSSPENLKELFARNSSYRKN